MTLPLDLATSTSYNQFSMSEHPTVPVKRYDALPSTAEHWVGSIYTVPGLSARDGFIFCQVNGDLVCLVNRGLAGFKPVAFKEALKRIKQHIIYENYRVARTYEHKPFKRLIGLSQLHAYRVSKRETTRLIREKLGLAEDTAISYLTPTAAADTVKSVALIEQLAKLPIPVAVIRKHHIDGHLYIPLEIRGFCERCTPVAIVSAITKETLRGISNQVDCIHSASRAVGNYWGERVLSIETIMESLQ